MLRSRASRLAVAALCIATLLAAPLWLAQDPDALSPASTARASGVTAAPFLALAILAAMSGLVLLVAFRPVR